MGFCAAVVSAMPDGWLVAAGSPSILYKISDKIRPQQLSFESYVALYKALHGWLGLLLNNLTYEYTGGVGHETNLFYLLSYPVIGTEEGWIHSSHSDVNAGRSATLICVSSSIYFTPSNIFEKYLCGAVTLRSWA